jgi:DNA gyrase subunit A
MTETIDPQPRADLADELSTSYLQYAMSVIVGRALPDVRDGLKPVHRRILYAMKEGGYLDDKPYRKSARIVGDVLGHYHPHGDTAVYDAMVRMAQDFSMSLPLVDGQGNLGSTDGDNPAAMRYTEARMARVARRFLLEDIDRDTVDWQPNYDNSEHEPAFLPAAFPNLLVNGSEGIAVGMATRIPPHNPREACHAALTLLRDPEAATGSLLAAMPGPDFPTGGVILGREGIRTLYETGKGSIRVRARHTFEDRPRGAQAIVFTELPYQVNKARLVERISELGKQKEVEGIQAVRDESDRNGTRLVVEVRREAEPDVVLAQLSRKTEVQKSFPAAMLAIDKGQPRVMNLREILQAFIDFRRDVVRRRTLHDLRAARRRMHVVAGLIAAVEQIDRVIQLIRGSSDPESARKALMAEPMHVPALAARIAEADPSSVVADAALRLTEAQAKAILELRLHRLTGLERDKLVEEFDQLETRIAEDIRILSSDAARDEVVSQELERTAEALAVERRTSIEEDYTDYDDEDLIPREELVVTMTKDGWVKRVPLNQYRAQARNGKGKAGMQTKEGDVVTRIMACSTHTPILIFTDRGIAYRIKAHQLPAANPQGRGRPIINVLPIPRDEQIAAVLPLPESSEADLHLAFVTATGTVRRNSLDDFARVPRNGKIAMKLRDESGEPVDRLVNVLLHGAADHLALYTVRGQVIRFPADEVRVFSGRGSLGVRGIRLRDDDHVIAATVIDDARADGGEAAAYLARAAQERKQDNAMSADDAPGELSDARYAEMQARECFVLSVTDRGFGKRTSSYAYRVTARGGIGVRDKAQVKAIGAPVGSATIRHDQQVVLVTDQGQVIRIPAESIRITGRGAKGVRLFSIDPAERIVSFAIVDADPAQDAATDASDAPAAGETAAGEMATGETATADDQAAAPDSAGT